MIIKIVTSYQIEILVFLQIYHLSDINRKETKIMNEENEYECRNEEGVIDMLCLEEWQIDLDNQIVILSSEFRH